MADPGPYASPSAVVAAIKSAALNAHQRDPRTSVDELIRREEFNRFLSRVFSESESSNWVLKGGTGILMRVPLARATQDIDLYCSGSSLDKSLAELVRFASTDLGDHFRFTYIRHSEILGAGAQSRLSGYRVVFDTSIGTQRRASIRVDLATGLDIYPRADRNSAPGLLALPRLVTHRPRLYPIAEQIADKVSATMQTYSGRPSSRVKDLVDLVILANTQCIHMGELWSAIRVEVGRRCSPPFEIFTIPGNWRIRYEKLAREIPACSQQKTLADARELMADFIAPAITATMPPPSAWSPETLTWNPLIDGGQTLKAR